MRLATLLVTAAALAVPLASQSPLPPPDLAPGQSYRIMALTHVATDATSDDINVYNSFAHQSAITVPELAALGGVWRAVVSTESVSARDNTGTDPTPAGSTGVPIYRVDGTRIANDYDQLWGADSMPLLTPPGMNVFGNFLDQEIWTGSDASGLPFRPLGFDGDPTVGVSATLGGLWVDFLPRSRVTSNPVYAMSDVLTVPQALPAPDDLPPGAQYRILTLTDGTRNALSSNVDDYNQFVAGDVGSVPELDLLGAEWRALASTPSVSARDNTGTDASAPGIQGVPIYLRDGRRVANHDDDLWGGLLSVAPDVTSSGGAPSVNLVWTGTNPDGSSAGNLALGGFGASIRGDSTSISSAWVSTLPLSGTTNLPLYALSSVLTKPISGAVNVTGVSCNVSTTDGPVTSISYVPNGVGGFTITAGSGVAYDASNLGFEIVTDDDFLTTVDLGWAFPWLGGSASASLDIDSNGKIGPTGSFFDYDVVSTVDAFLGISSLLPFTGPGLAAFWTDLEPGDAPAPGALDQIRFFTDGAGAANITWLEVNQFGGDEPLTFQVQLEASGAIHVVYRSISRFDPQVGGWGNLLIGYSAAPGMAVGESDFFPGSIDTGSAPTAYEFWHRTDVDVRDIQGPGGDAFLTLAADTLPVLGGVLELTAFDLPIFGTSASVLAAGLVPIAPIPFSLIDADNPCLLTTNADLFTLFAPVGVATHTFVQDFTMLMDPALAGTAIDYQVISVSDTFPFFTTDPSGDGSFPFATSNGIQAVFGMELP